VFLFVIGRKKKLKIDEGSKMGLNLSGGLKVSNCGPPAPAVRRPKIFDSLCGRLDCANCGKNSTVGSSLSTEMKEDSNWGIRNHFEDLEQLCDRFKCSISDCLGIDS